MTYKEWNNYMQIRREIISKNRSNRLKHLPLLQVPEKIECPKVLAAFESDGTYYGIIDSLEDLPAGYKFKMVDAIR